MSEVTIIKDKRFKPFILEDQIQVAVQRVAAAINKELESEFPVFLVVLNGSFMFAADLLKKVVIPCEICFMKVASYQGTGSTGKLQELIGVSEDLSGRTVVIVEDIVDSGFTLERIFGILEMKKVKQVKVATALLKPASYKKPYVINYVGFEIENEFVVGYGLDYDGQGRNLKDIYILA